MSSSGSNSSKVNSHWFELSRQENDRSIVLLSFCTNNWVLLCSKEKFWEWLNGQNTFMKNFNKVYLKKKVNSKQKDTYYKHKAFILIPTLYILLYGTYNIVLNGDWDIFVGGTEAHRSVLGKPGMLTMQGCFFKKKKRWIICLLLIRLWMNVD